MKVGQLTEYNMRKNFLEKLYKKCGGPFYKKSKRSMFVDQHSKMLWNLSLMYVQVEVHQNIFKLRCFSLHKAFLKNKTSGASLPTSFSVWVLKKNISNITFYHGDIILKVYYHISMILLAVQISLPDCPYFLRHVLVIVQFRVQYDQYFLSFSYFADLFHEPISERNNSKIWEIRKTLAILY